MNPTILQTLRDFKLDDYRPILPRDLDLGDVLPPRRGNLVKVVVGMRRSGKSYRLLQEMEAIEASGVDSRRLCYFNFEDDRLDPVTPQTGDELLEAFYSLCPEALEEGAFLFLDELQEMEGWGGWLRRVIDTHKVTVYASGSSSKMLSADIATNFRGRSLDFELLPYSFAELARQRGLVDPSGVPSTRQTLELQQLMESYLNRGGFPDAQGLSDPLATTLLQSYVQRVVSRDVVERHELARPRVAALFAQRVLATNGKELSIRKVENDLRSAGMATSRETLGNLLGYLEDAYLVFPVSELSRSLSKTASLPPKVYAVDPGLALAGTKVGISDLGQRLEDAVYLELRRRHPGSHQGTVATLRTREHACKVDFALGDPLDGSVAALYQVCTSMEDSKTRDRELRTLWEAMEERSLPYAELIVLQGEAVKYQQDGRTIQQLPARQWFLGEKPLGV